MLRSILLGALAIAAAGACKGGDAGNAPEVQPGQTVGKVLEISGVVTATRGGEARPLAVGGEVSGDDVIATGSDSRVTIRLAHNNAVWDLGPGKQQKVSDSMAWSMAKVDTPAGRVDETTTAAGRHAERSAADGEASSASRTRETAPVAPPTPAASADTNMPAPGGPPPTAQPQAAAAMPAPPAPPPAPPPPPPPPPKTKGGPPPTATAKNDDLGAELDKVSGGAPSAGASGGEAPSVTPEQIQSAVKSVKAQLEACVARSGQASLKITLHVKPNKTTIEVPDGSDADRACFAKVASKIKLNGTVDATMTINTSPTGE